MEIYEPSDKELRIILIKKFGEQQKKTTKMKLRKQCMSKKRSSAIKQKRFKKTEILEIKNTMNELKNSIQSFNSRLHQA